MRVGGPKEVKTHEYRVGLVPGSVRELVHHGEQVFCCLELGHNNVVLVAAANVVPVRLKHGGVLGELCSSPAVTLVEVNALDSSDHRKVSEGVFVFWVVVREVRTGPPDLVVVDEKAQSW